MALVRIPDEDRTITAVDEVRAFLASIGIDHEWWDPARVDETTPPDETLAAYRAEIERVSAAGGYTTADVIDLQPDTPGLDTMLGRFSTEHWHDEDEVRFIIAGSGLFHVSPPDGPVCAVEVEAGDLLRVPRGTRHWFDLCGSRRIRAIRLFQDPTGWSPHYTGSGMDESYQPVCLGPTHIGLGRGTPR